ncbi:MAG: SDR family oxidoreductase [Flavobacteriales bacterium]|nr:SDR family oxidoreductase [Flavobacteriales bacterium]
MKTVLVTGSNGLLGQKLTDLYLHEKDIKLIATGKGQNRHPEKEGYLYAEMDIADRENVQTVVEKYRPNTIIHTAAMTNVDACELDPTSCQISNVDAVENMVYAANSVDAHLIHLSTDFIFDGLNGPYKEEAIPNPLSIYGQAKLDAENIITSNCKNWAIARTVLVYGLVADMSRSNIVLWAKESLENHKKINVVDDQFRTPTLAEDLAMGCHLIERQKAQGIFNISGKDFMSIFELVQRVANHYGLSMENVSKINSKTLNQPAKRPPITGFDLSKSKTVLGYEPHSFDQGIDIVYNQFLKSQAL